MAAAAAAAQREGADAGARVGGAVPARRLPDPGRPAARRAAAKVHDQLMYFVHFILQSMRKGGREGRSPTDVTTVHACVFCSLHPSKYEKKEKRPNGVKEASKRPYASP
jgi:hypothetical protein